MARTFQKTEITSKSTNRVQQVKDFLELHYEIKINIFAPDKSFIVCKDEKRYTDTINWEDISLHMEEEGVRGCDSILKKILKSPNQVTVFNPIVDFVNSLDGAWKGESHIDKLCQFITVREFPGKPDNYYHDRFKRHLKKWMAASIATVIGTDKKRDKNDVVLGFISAFEGIGKSTFIESLVPEPLKYYYRKSDKDPRYFDLIKSFATSFIINFDDNVGLTKPNAEPIKSVLSSKTIDIGMKSFPRMGNALMSSNKNPEMGGFLLPELGTRRWALTEFLAINQEYSEVIDVFQMWAEAYVLFKEPGFNHVWDQADFDDFAEENMRYMQQTNACRLISEFYRVPEKDEPAENIIWKQPIEILQDLRAAKKLTAANSNNVSDITIGFAMRQFNYERTAVRKDGGPRYGYKVVQLY